MNFLDKMERKYGRYALSHLTMYIIVTYIAGYIIALAAPIMRQYLTLEPYYILHGQIWRLVSWILIPPSSLDIFTIIMLYFYFSLQSMSLLSGAVPVCACFSSPSPTSKD